MNWSFNLTFNLTLAALLGAEYYRGVSDSKNLLRAPGWAL